MATAIDRSRREAIERQPGILDVPQQLGILPTRRFWMDPDVGGRARYILAFAAANVLFLVVLLNPSSWWVAGLTAGAGTLLAQGLIERVIRRRLRTCLEQEKFGNRCA
jgi:hypothetical protein